MLWNGVLRVPVSLVSADGKVIGDAAKEIAPGEPGYDDWLPFVRQRVKPGE